MKQRLIKWTFNILIWTLAAVLSASLYHFSSEADIAKLLPKTWGGMFFLHLPYWYLWALITPFIFHTARKIPLQKGGWGRAAALHLSFSVLWMGIYSILSVFIGSLQYNVEGRNLFDFAGRMLDVRFYIEYFIYWLILVDAYFIHYFQKSRINELEAAQLSLKNSQLENQMFQSQLQSLKAQLHPHFLFNTLNSISALIRKGEKDSAVNMLAALSDLLRNSMEKDRVQFVTLREEADFISKYLEIQLMRYRDRMSVDMRIDSEVGDAVVPNMILQPLVENAVRHGIAENLEMGRLEIFARRSGKDLQIEIYNDGPNLPEDWSIEQNKRLGLTNTMERLLKLYGDDCVFELNNVESKGVSAKLIIPLNLNGASAEWKSIA